MTPEIADEIRMLLDEHGLEHSRAAEFASGAELALESVVAVATVGGAASLAAVITAYIKRHANKRVILERDRETYEGYSEDEVKRMVQERAKAQADREAEWDRQKGQS